MNKTLYDELGGFSEVRKLIKDFYQKVLDVDELSELFAEVDMERLIDHQTKFFAMLLGGPASYTDKEIEMVHRRIPINNNHFNLTKECLQEAMEDFDMEDEHIEFVLNAFESKRQFVVNK